MKIAVDFDGTIVEHRYPEIGREIPFAVTALKQLMREGHLLILWSVREGQLLDDAIQWCEERGIEFYAINSDFPVAEDAEMGVVSRKIKADIFIDDRNIGGLPDWAAIYEMIHTRQSYDRFLRNALAEGKPKKKPWWKRL